MGIVNNKNIFNRVGCIYATMKGWFLGGGGSLLIKSEEEVMSLISKGCTTAKQLSTRRGKSTQSTYKI